MKHSIVIIAFLMLIALQLLSVVVKATTGGEGISYIKTRKALYFGQDLKIGLFNSKIISSDGIVTKISKRDIVGYMHDSRIFEYLPVMSESNDFLCYAMMELKSTRSGYKLYQYTCYDEKNIKCYYFVFKDSKYCLRVDQRNAMTVLPFFGFKNVKLSES